MMEIVVTSTPPGGFNKIVDATKEAIALSLKYTAANAWENLKKEAPKDEGFGAGSLQLVKNNDLEWKIFSSMEYMYYANSGTKPHYAPWGPIKRWAERHNRPPFPIWYGILMKGTKANKYVDRALEQTQSRIDDFIKRAMRETLPVTI